MLVLLHLLDDAGHHGHRIDGIVATGGFRRQHHRIGAVIDGGGHVRRLGPGGGGGMDHGIQHLGGHHHGLAGGAAGADDALLQDRHGLGRHFHAQVAARHHDAVGQLDDGVQMFDGAGLFQLGHDHGAAVHQAARLGHVLGPLHEGQRHPVHTHVQAEGQVGQVLLGQGRDGQHHIGNIQTLVVGQLAAGDHPGFGVIQAVMLDPQADAAVVQQQFGAHMQGVEHLGVQQRCALAGAGGLVHVQAEHLAGLQRRLAIFELAHAQLGALQVHQHADGAAGLAFQGADGFVALQMVLVRAVAEIQAEHIGTSQEQALDGLGRGRGGAEGGEDLGVTGASHERSLMMGRRKLAQPFNLFLPRQARANARSRLRKFPMRMGTALNGERRPACTGRLSFIRLPSGPGQRLRRSCSCSYRAFTQFR